MVEIVRYIYRICVVLHWKMFLHIGKLIFFVQTIFYFFWGGGRKSILNWKRFFEKKLIFYAKSLFIHETVDFSNKNCQNDTNLSHTVYEEIYMEKYATVSKRFILLADSTVFVMKGISMFLTFPIFLFLTILIKKEFAGGRAHENALKS